MALDELGEIGEEEKKEPRICELDTDLNVPTQVWDAIEKAFHHRGKSYGLKWKKDPVIYSTVLSIKTNYHGMESFNNLIYESDEYGYFVCDFGKHSYSSIPFQCVDRTTVPSINYTTRDMDMFLEIMEQIALHPPFNPDKWCLIIDDIDGNRYSEVIKKYWDGETPNILNPFRNLHIQRNKELHVWMLTMFNKSAGIGTFTDDWYITMIMLAGQRSLHRGGATVHIPSINFYIGENKRIINENKLWLTRFTKELNFMFVNVIEVLENGGSTFVKAVL